MSEALDRIREYALAFTVAIERLRIATNFYAADWQDAYNRLNRLKDRYEHEKPNLDPAEAEALRKVFEDDAFIKEMLYIRQVGEHVHNRRIPEIRLMTNGRPVCVTTSALGFFAAPIVRLPDARGELQAIDHLRNLDNADARIGRAVQRAMKKLP